MSRKTRRRRGGSKRVRFIRNVRPNKPIPTQVYGTSIQNWNANNQALRNSRRSIPEQPRIAMPSLEPRNAKVLANLWATYNVPQNMIEALEETNLNENAKNRVLERLMYLGENLVFNS